MGIGKLQHQSPASPYNTKPFSYFLSYHKPQLHIGRPGFSQDSAGNFHQPEKRRHTNMALLPQGQREFSTGLFDCLSDWKSCLCICFLFPYDTCLLAERLGENKYLTGFCLAPVSWVAMRTKLRTMYSIRGDICGDYCAVMCCTCCAICQLEREMTHVGL